MLSWAALPPMRIELCAITVFDILWMPYDNVAYVAKRNWVWAKHIRVILSRVFKKKFLRISWWQMTNIANIAENIANNLKLPIIWQTRPLIILTFADKKYPSIYISINDPASLWQQQTSQIGLVIDKETHSQADDSAEWAHRHSDWINLRLPFENTMRISLTTVIFVGDSANMSAIYSLCFTFSTQPRIRMEIEATQKRNVWMALSKHFCCCQAWRMAPPKTHEQERKKRKQLTNSNLGHLRNSVFSFWLLRSRSLLNTKMSPLRHLLLHSRTHIGAPDIHENQSKWRQ